MLSSTGFVARDPVQPAGSGAQSLSTYPIVCPMFGQVTIEGGPWTSILMMENDPVDAFNAPDTGPARRPDVLITLDDRVTLVGGASSYRWHGTGSFRKLTYKDNRTGGFTTLRPIIVLSNDPDLLLMSEIL